MPEPRPAGGLREFLAEGGATLAGEGRLAARLAAAVTRARKSLPAAAAFASTPAVACIPVGTRPERSLALRAAVALGMSAIAVCPVTPAGAMAPPAAGVTEQGAFVGTSAAEARQRARAIMSAFTPLTQRMAEELHPDILQVMALARRRSGLDFEIVPGTGGKRTLEMQRALVSRGASKTMTSRHTTGLALDIVPVRTVGGVKVPDFFDKAAFYKVDAAMRAAAAELGVRLTSGLEFKTFVDLGHFELEKHSYVAYAPGDPSVRTMVADGGALPPGGAFRYGAAARGGLPAAVRDRVASATPLPAATPRPGAGAVTPGSGGGSTATPRGATPSDPDVTGSVAARRAPPRGVPRPADGDGPPEAPTPRM